MQSIFVQFSDSTQAAIISVFANAQSEDDYPNQGVIDSSDARYQAYYDSLPDVAKEFMTAPGA